MRLLEYIFLYLLFLLTLYIGISTVREWNTYNLICPPSIDGEKIKQIHSDGVEVLCIYNEKSIHKPQTYKKGYIQWAGNGKDGKP